MGDISYQLTPIPQSLTQKSPLPGAVKQDFGRSNSTICPDYQTGLLWYEKQASRRRKRGYVSKDKLSQD